MNDEVMYRVLKKDVLKDLPDKMYAVVPFKIDLREYDKKRREFELAMRMKGFGYPEALAMLNKMRQVAVTEKMNQCVRWIKDILDTGSKLVIFGVHHATIDSLMEEFPKEAVKLDGRDSSAKKDLAVRRFQEDVDIQLFVGNVEAAGVGIDGLQNACSNVAFIELPWVPAMVDQASDRLHRIGQKDSVMVYYLIAEGTVEEQVAAKLDHKRTVLDAVVDGKETEQGSLIMELVGKVGGLV